MSLSDNFSLLGTKVDRFALGELTSCGVWPSPDMRQLGIDTLSDDTLFGHQHGEFYLRSHSDLCPCPKLDLSTM
jgi:hypothetical protein